VASVAGLGMQVFRAFPYLYDGDMAYETAYLEAYARSPDSVFVLAFDGAAVVGAATGIPLADDDAVFQAPVRARGPPGGEVFAFGDSVVFPADPRPRPRWVFPHSENGPERCGSKPRPTRTRLETTLGPVLTARAFPPTKPGCSDREVRCRLHRSPPSQTHRSVGNECSPWVAERGRSADSWRTRCFEATTASAIETR